MTNKEYENVVRSTASKNPQIEEGIIGMASESGEVLDILKKHLFQGHELERDNLIEEVGDVLWYLMFTCIQMDITLEELMEANAEKIRKRYPDGFDPEKSVNRDGSTPTSKSCGNCRHYHQTTCVWEDNVVHMDCHPNPCDAWEGETEPPCEECYYWFDGACQIGAKTWEMDVLHAFHRKTSANTPVSQCQPCVMFLKEVTLYEKSKKS